MSKKAKKEAGSPAQNKISVDEMLATYYHPFYDVVKKEFPGLFLTGLEPIKKPMDLNPNILIILSNDQSIKVKAKEVSRWLYNHKIDYVNKRVHNDDVISINLYLLANQNSLKVLFANSSKVGKKEVNELANTKIEDTGLVRSDLSDDTVKDVSDEPRKYTLEEELILEASIEAEKLKEEGMATHLIINRFFKKVFDLTSYGGKTKKPSFACFVLKNRITYNMHNLGDDWKDTIGGKIFKNFEEGTYKYFPEFFGRHEMPKRGARGFIFFLDEVQEENKKTESDQKGEPMLGQENPVALKTQTESSFDSEIVQLLQKHRMLPQVKTLEEYSKEELLDCLRSKTTTGELMTHLVNLGCLEQITSSKTVLFEIIK